MTHGSLFSGIGGFDLAAEWMGWENLFNCEWEEFPRKVLKHHFPNAKQYGDIKEFNATDYAGRIDILTGGFPCQPYSVAGKRKGKEDERHLWPQMLRIIRECSPRWIVGENVRGLVNWNGGLVFEEVCADLETCGYSVQPFILPACAVNAPHRRDRVWFIAHWNTNGEKRRRSKRKVQEGKSSDTSRNIEQLRGFVAHANDKGRGNGYGQIQSENGERSEWNDNAQLSNTDSRNATHADSGGWNEGSKRKHNKIGKRSLCKNEPNHGDKIWSEFRSSSMYKDASNTDGAIGTSECINRQRQGEFVRRSSDTIPDRWEEFPTVTPVCGGDDGLPKELDGITFSKWRRESIKAYGNAIVPQVAFQIFKAIEAYEFR